MCHSMLHKIYHLSLNKKQVLYCGYILFMGTIALLHTSINVERVASICIRKGRKIDAAE